MNIPFNCAIIWHFLLAVIHNETGRMVIFAAIRPENGNTFYWSNWKLSRKWLYRSQSSLLLVCRMVMEYNCPEWAKK